MTDKVQKIREEVERLRSLHQIKYQQLDADNSMSLVECGKRNLCNELLSFIDSLQEEPVSEELDEAIEKSFVYHDSRGDDFRSDKQIEIAYRQGFETGAKWQKEKDQKTIELAEDHAMLTGMNKMKEQMMKDATEVTVHIDAGNYPYIPQLELYDYDKDVPLAKEGDKYKVVLIKED